MSATALQVERSSLHPVPGGALVDDSRQLLKRAAAFSVALHFALVAIALVITYWHRSASVGAPQEALLDITIVPLSALDTVLPKGEAPAPSHLPQSESVAPEQPQEQSSTDQNKPQPPPKKREPLNKIAASKALTIKHASAPDTAATRSSDATSNPSAPQPFGVANGDAAPLDQARISYRDMVATIIARAKRYPESALKRGMTGEGSIRLEISADGSLANFQIVRSTETPILDEELRAMVERAAPFPPFPSDLRENSLALVVPIAFRLKS